MISFKELYRWICNTPITWSDLMNMVLIRLEKLVYMEWEM